VDQEKESYLFDSNEIDSSRNRSKKPASRLGVYLFSSFVFLFVLAVAAAFVLLSPEIKIWKIVVGALAALLAVSLFHIALDWEKIVILRFGKYHRTVGPGLFFVIPIIEFVTARIDQRTITTPFMAEKTLTADTVPINVDAVLFWMVWDARKATLEVQNYDLAVSWAAQTAMRDIIGRTTLATILTNREKLDAELRDTIDQKTESWGITVVSVEIRDIIIPDELQDAMSKEAQAERERNARIILTKAEKAISEMFVEVSNVYKENETALQLRVMNLVYEGVKERGGLVVVPSLFSDGFNIGLRNRLDKDIPVAEAKKELKETSE